MNPNIFFCEICEIFKNTCFYRALPVAASNFKQMIDYCGLSKFQRKLQTATQAESSQKPFRAILPKELQ